MRWQWWIEAFFYMRDTGTLPGCGGYFNQNWKYMEIFSVIRNTYAQEQGRQNRLNGR